MITIDNGQAFRNALDVLKHVVPKQTPLPILEHVLLESDGCHLTLRGTDTTSTAMVGIACPGPTLDPVGVHLLQLQKAIGKGKGRVTLAPNSGSIAVGTGAASVTLPTLPGRDFPKFPEFPSSWRGYPAPRFLDGMKYVERAISLDESRLHLCGAYVNGVLAATDGHRMHLGPGLDGLCPKGAILPHPAVNAILCAGRKFPAIDSVMGASYGAPGFAFRFMGRDGSAYIWGRAIDAQFPPYEEVIPRRNEAQPITVDANAMASACKRLRQVRDAIKLDMATGERGISVSADGEDGASAKALIASTEAEKNLTIGFNARYLEEAAELGGELSLRFGLALDPCLVNGPDPSMYAVVMPCRV